MIHTDSRLVTQGDIFVAIPCKNVIEHIQQGLQNGASVIFTETPFDDNRVVVVNDAFLLASRFSRVMYPLQPKNTLAVTGTNGKSSTVHFVCQILKNCGYKTANLGTLGLFINGVRDNTIKIPNLTTPDAMSLHKVLYYLNKISANYCAFEASSAALDQKRLHSVALSAAAFTNFASDHLDYHKTRSNYLDAKLQLFSNILPQDKPAIVSADDLFLYNKVKNAHHKVISCGYNPKNMIYAYNISNSINKIKFDLTINNTIFKNLELNLFGRFQLSNVLTAIGLVYATRISPDKIVNTIPFLTPLTGRMECVAVHNGGYIFVDYAHTSEGFKNALAEFRKYANRLICVFGCGGDRDKTKRQEMGTIANKFADVVIITDDNPRNEDPAIIRKEILSTCTKGKEIANREEAIAYAIKLIYPGDIVAVIGKGHETVQIYGNKEYSLNDKLIIKELTKNKDY